MKTIVYPNLSIIIVAKNVSKIIEKCLDCIDSQNYQKSKIEIVFVDGGSNDNTKSLVKKYKVKWIDGGYPDNQEARRFIGCKQASGEILVFIDADNFIYSKNWLIDMVNPLIYSNASCSFTKWYEYRSENTALDNYYALIGGNDPVAYYLSRNDRNMLGSLKLPFGSKLLRKDRYAEYVIFEKLNMPAIGCNGFLIKKELISRLRIEDPNDYYHTDIHVDLIEEQPSIIYAIVPNYVCHAPGGTLIGNLRKRLKYQSIHSCNTLKNRRYLVFDVKNARNILSMMYIIFCTLIIVPYMIKAISGYYKTKKIEWFLHPLVTTLMVYFYAFNKISSIFVLKQK
jgi:glycosyltransferase involved in cell wall biosynthesis